MPTLIDKKEAANLLQVSTRTIDRYITSKQLSRKFQEGKVYLQKDQVMKLSKRRHRKVYEKQEDKLKRQEAVYQESISKIEEPKVVREPVDENRITKEKFYKEMHEEIKNELKMYQQKLEGANYRVGQLEAKLETAIPLLEHERKLLLEQKEVKQLKAANRETYSQLDVMQREYETETLNKKVLLAVIVVLLILQPIWLLLNFF
jgi:hypothetical protein